MKKFPQDSQNVDTSWKLISTAKFNTLSSNFKMDIPVGYDDVKVLISGTSDSGGGTPYLLINSDSTNIYGYNCTGGGSGSTSSGGAGYVGYTTVGQSYKFILDLELHDSPNLDMITYDAKLGYQASPSVANGSVSNYTLATAKTLSIVSLPCKAVTIKIYGRIRG